MTTIAPLRDTSFGSWGVAITGSNRWERNNQTLRFVASAGSVAGASILAGLGGPLGGPILCPLRALTGIPCPLCGMTTSFTYTAAGDLGSAFVASPAGPLLFAVAIVVALVSAVLLVHRRRLEFSYPRWLVLLAALPVGAVWMYQLFHIGPFA